MRKQQAEAQAKQASDGAMFLAGALEDLKYMGDTWVTERTHTGPMMVVAQNPKGG